MFAKLGRVFAAFRRAEDAVVAIQVTIFSIMLLTSAGLVIDFGRAYSAHTQMQSFVDKAALAAAAELDGEPDALIRATAAARAVSQTSNFFDDEAAFTVALPLTFYARDPDLAGSGLDPNNPASNAMTTTDPSLAKYVFVQAESRTIELTLMSVGLNPDVTNAARVELIERGYLIENQQRTSESDAVDVGIEWLEENLAAELYESGYAENTDDGTVLVYSNSGGTGAATEMTAAQLSAYVTGAVATYAEANGYETNEDGSFRTNPFTQASSTASDELRAWLDEISADDGSIQSPSAIRMESFAVAKLETSYCGPLSTLVMCNPFEDDPRGRSFTEIMDGQEGTRMLLTAELDTNSGAPMALDTSDNEIRLGILANPWDEIGADPTGICAEENLSAFQGAAYAPNALGTEIDPRETTPVSTSMLRDMCYLATIDAGLQCIGSEVLVEPAHPETVTTALNTVFDIWDAPLDRVLNQNITSDRDFAPDYVSAHGKMTREEIVSYYTDMQSDSADEYYARQAEMDEASERYYAVDATTEDRQAALADYQSAARGQQLANANYIHATNEIAAAAVNYPPNIRNTASRRNMVAGEGFESQWGPMILGDSCLDTSNGNPNDCDYIQWARTDAGSLENDSGQLVSAPYPASEVEYPEIEISDGGTAGSTGSECTPGNSESSGNANPNACVDIAERTYTGFSLGENGSIAGWTIVNNSDTDNSIYVSYTDTEDGAVAPDVGFILNVPANKAIDFETSFVYPLSVSWETGDVINLPMSDDSFSGLSNATDVVLGLAPTFSSYFTLYYNPYELANGLDVTEPNNTVEWDVAGATTMYDGYSTVERQYADLLLETMSAGSDEIQSLPRHYQFSTAPSVEQPEERRLQRVTVVNCGNLNDPVVEPGHAANPDHAGAFLANVVGVADLFMTRDVQVVDCPGMTGEDDMLGALECWNSEINRAYVHVEYNGIQTPSAVVPEDFLSYAVLVQ